MSDVRTVHSTPVAAQFASATGSPLVWDSTNAKAYLLADGDIVTQIAGAGTGTVTSVSGAGTVNGITLTGTVTTSGSLTLGGTLSGVSLTTQVTGTLPYGNGGTGATSLTNHGAVVAGASALSTVAPGTSGNLLTSNGTDWTSAAPATSGTVTSVSVTTANGVSGTVATATTTPAITLTLGAITPTSVAATTTVSGTTLTASTNVSLPNGSTGALALNFTGETGTGFYKSASQEITYRAGGANGVSITDLGVKVANNGLIGFTSGTSTLNWDTYFLRASSGVFTCTNDISLRNLFASTLVRTPSITTASGALTVTPAAGSNINLAVSSTGVVTVNGTSNITLGTANNFQVQGTTLATASEGISAWSADVNGARLELGKSRGAAIGTNTIVQSGDELAIIAAYGANGSTFNTAAAIQFSCDGTPGASNDMPGRIICYTTPDGSGTLATALTINNKQAVLSATTLNTAGYTVATLPAGVTGASAYCTDLLLPSFLAVAVGGGAVVGKVFYNGSNWVTD